MLAEPNAPNGRALTFNLLDRGEIVAQVANEPLDAVTAPQSDRFLG